MRRSVTQFDPRSRALQDEQERIEAQYQDAEEYPLDVEARMGAIEERIEELNDQPRKYREEEIALAGAIVSLGGNGQTSIYRGLVRPEDKKKMRDVESQITGEGEPNGSEEQEAPEPMQICRKCGSR
jgi:ParB family transcriptional regulator, chromosome partitioning protein